MEVMARACVLWACSRWAPGGFCCVFSLLQDLYNVSVRVSEEQGTFQVPTQRLRCGERSLDQKTGHGAWESAFHTLPLAAALLKTPEWQM